MSRGGNDRSGWGHRNELIGPGDGPAAPPGQYQIGDNIPWDRLGPMVPRPTTYRKLMEELEHALTFKGDLEIMQWIMVNLRTSASLMSIACTYWTRALVEIAEFLDDLDFAICGEIQEYVKDLAHEVDATLWLSVGVCIHGWGVGWGRVGWDNNVTGSLTHTSCYTTVHSLGLPRVRHATLLDVVLDIHTSVMLRYWTFSWTSTHPSCYATVRSLQLPGVHHTTLFYFLYHRPLKMNLRGGEVRKKHTFIVLQKLIPQDPPKYII